MKKTIFLCVWLCAMMILSCQQDPLDDFQGTVDQIPDDIISKVQQAGFDTRIPVLPFKEEKYGLNGYIVENDIYVTEARLDEMIRTGERDKIGRVQHYRTHNLVTGCRTIRVAISAGFQSSVHNALNTAIARYNAELLSLTFQLVTSSPDITISPFFQQSSLLGVSPGFPSNGNPGNQILLNTFWFNNTTNMADAGSIIAHEIGHAIGFRHTDYQDRTYSCGGPGPDPEPAEPNGANHVPGTPTGASSNSWMLACANGNDRPFTTSDKLALHTVYHGFVKEELYLIRNQIFTTVDNTSGARVTVDCVDWSNPEGMCSTSGYIFTVQGGSLYKTDVNTNDGATTSFGSGWSGTEAMAGLGGYIYAVQAGTLYRVTGSNGSTITFSDYPNGWTGTEAMAALSGYLYAVQAGTLYRVNISNGDVEAFSDYPNGWSGTEAMTAYNGYIYAVQAGEFWKVSTSTGSVVSLGAGWSGTEAMTTYGGYIYTVQGGQLYRTDPGTGNTTWVAGDFGGTQVMAGLQ